MTCLAETILEETVFEWFESPGSQTAFGPDISPSGPACERQDYDNVLLVGRFQVALENVHPGTPLDETEVELEFLEPGEARLLGEEPNSERWADASAWPSGVAHEENVCLQARSVEANPDFLDWRYQQFRKAI